MSPTEITLSLLLSLQAPGRSPHARIFLEECDEACEYLEGFELLGFDTETKTFVDGSGDSSTEAASAACLVTAGTGVRIPHNVPRCHFQREPSTMSLCID